MLTMAGRDVAVTADGCDPDGQPTLTPEDGGFVAMSMCRDGFAVGAFTDANDVAFLDEIDRSLHVRWQNDRPSG